MKTENVSQHAEGSVAHAIEQQTAKMPSDWFLWAAGASIVSSLILRMNHRDRDAEFTGLWVPTFLMLGVYNKIVKLMGSDATEHYDAEPRRGLSHRQ